MPHTAVSTPGSRSARPFQCCIKIFDEHHSLLRTISYADVCLFPSSLRIDSSLRLLDRTAVCCIFSESQGGIDLVGTWGATEASDTTDGTVRAMFMVNAVRIADELSFSPLQEN